MPKKLLLLPRYSFKMKKLVAGIHIGGTGTAYALVDEFGKIYASGNFPTGDYPDFNDFVAALKKEIKELSLQLNQPHEIEAIGIGAPNGNYYTGEIENATNLVWKGKLPLARQLSALFNGIPTVVTNDANAAAIGEMIYGGAKGMKNFTVITLGTGLGSGIIVDGNVLYGHDGFAGEFGHIRIVKENGRECGCGRTGCLEGYASARGVKRTAFELMGRMLESSTLKEIPYNKLTSKDIAIAAKAGDSIAKQTLEITGEMLGEALADLVAITAPEAIFLFGEMAYAGDMLLNPTKKSFEKNVMPLWKGKVKVILSSVDSEEAPLLGAAALAIKEIQKRNTVTGLRRVI